MSVVTTIATVSYRYYDKRPRSTCERNIESMCQALGKPVPNRYELVSLTKPNLIRLALNLHNEFPD